MLARHFQYMSLGMLVLHRFEAGVFSKVVLSFLELNFNSICSGFMMVRMFVFHRHIDEDDSSKPTKQRGEVSKILLQMIQESNVASQIGNEHATMDV